MSTLVNVDADTPIKLVGQIADLLGESGPGFRADCEALVKSEDGAALFDKMLSKGDEIFGMENDFGR